jgi:hypothetical protein
LIVTFVLHRDSVIEYIRMHQEKQGLSVASSDAACANANPWSGSDFYRPVSATGANGGSVRVPPQSALITKSSAPRGGQILIYLLRLRQCCSHLSIMKEVRFESVQLRGHLT